MLTPTGITQSQATEWLQATTRQRRVVQSQVKRYAADMAAGRWVAEACPPILLSPSGAVIDGQHRLLALLLQEEGFVLISQVRLVDPSAIEVVDTGRPRSLADTLAVMGFDYTKELSATFYQSVKWANTTLASKETSRSVQLALIRNNPHIEKAAAVAHGLRHAQPAGTSIKSGVIGALWDRAQYGEGGDEVVAFVQMMHEGLYESDLLRRYANLLAEVRNPRSRSSMSPPQMALLTARVYAAWLTDENPQKLYARRNSLYLLPGFNEWAERAYRAETI